jgi:hypothetical protein
MFRILGFILLSVVLSTAHAEDLKPQLFTDQWDKQQVLDGDTRLIIYSNHKAGSGWVKEALEDLSSTDLDSRHWLYVANISKMPKMISKMFAIPKMRDYSFAVALVRDDEAVKSWPAETDKVMVYQLDNLSIQAIDYFDSAESLQAFLAGLPRAASSIATQ